ncbi:insulin-induced protein insIG [Nitzschia inconspicua]|uniref:Insulin-induced protein insIG n=1 Tax=Nitzschia inconspicua TaxID=303405 RepID=A0A9K3L724_9STRA|nr:insulin-induced protein insIG [Nitzschia inconspicua]
MALCGAVLGPFLDSYHSAFGVLQYDQPITAALWGSADHPALITAWWVPVLFGLAGWLIGWLYIALDAILSTRKNVQSPSPPKILVGIALFTFQYWLSGVFVATGILDRTGILNAMSLYAVTGFWVLDGSMAGFLTSMATALGGPLIEVGLLSLSRADMMPGGYHYTDLGETGFFPLWIAPVYFLGGPAVGNLARGFWNTLLRSTNHASPNGETSVKPGCPVCNDTRCVSCPNCDGVGQYTAMGGRSVRCTSCAGRGFVICRACFSEYDDDPNDIEAIREFMSRMPD